MHDAALQKLPVIFAIDRAGLNASDGATHHGIFDVAFMSSVPEMQIFTPATYESLERILRHAVTLSEPVAIRYPNAIEDPIVKLAFYNNEAADDIAVRSFSLTDAPKTVIITHGRMASTALEAFAMLAEDEIEISILLCEYIKPYGRLAQEISELLPDTVQNIVYLEEEILSGGFGMNLSQELRKCDRFESLNHEIIAVDDNFALTDSEHDAWQSAGVDVDSVYNKIKNMY